MFHKSIKNVELVVTQGCKYCMKFDILYGSQQVVNNQPSQTTNSMTTQHPFGSLPASKPFTFGSLGSNPLGSLGSSSLSSNSVSKPFTFGTNSFTPVSTSAPNSFTSNPVPVSNSFTSNPVSTSAPNPFTSTQNQVAPYSTSVPVSNLFGTNSVPRNNITLKNCEMFSFVGSNGLKFMDVEYKGEWLSDDLENKESMHRWNEVSRMEHVFRIETRFPGFVDTSMGRPPTDAEDYCVNCYEILPLDTDYKNCSGCLSKIISTNENLRQKLLADRSVTCGVEYKQGHSFYNCDEQATTMGACGKKTCLTHSRRVNYTLKE